MTASSWTLTARWILPIDSPPLPHGVLSIKGERIVALEPHGTGAADVDLGEVAVLPGLVNAHTHLDLTGLRGQCPPTPDFTQWLRCVIRHRRSRTPAQVVEDVKAGVAECARFGTTLLGDIAVDGASWDILKNAPLRAVVFRELIGLAPDRAVKALADARTWIETHHAMATCRPGLSPHAPYSARSDLIGRSKNLAEKHKAPVAIHLAETMDEMELMRNVRGPLVEFLQELDAWNPAGLARSAAQVMRAASWNLHIPQLWIHANYLARNMPIRPRDTIVYCPRTHAAFGHPAHPFCDFLERNRRVALGTDSLASNPDLDVLAEARFVHRHYPQVAPEQVLRMATLSGAEALGWADDTGSLTPGKSADLVAVPLPAGASGDPHALVLQGSEPVQAVLCCGRWLTKPRET